MDAWETKAKEILSLAEERGLEESFLFTTTFDRYNMQLRIMKDLQKQIEKDGPTVTKEYVKGRGNVYTNPAITEYNRTATAANQTVATLLKIVKSFNEDNAEEGDDELLQALGVRD